APHVRSDGSRGGDPVRRERWALRDRYLRGAASRGGAGRGRRSGNRGWRGDRYRDPAVRPGRGAGRMIRVEELSFAYRAGGDRVFEGLTHSFPSGAITAVTGPSGGGKSTLLYLIALMLRAREGAVFYGDREVTSLSDAARTQVRSASVGFVFQDA